MSSEFSSKILSVTKDDIDCLYSLIKTRQEPLFFNYLLNYVVHGKKEDVNVRVFEQELLSKLENDSRFIGFSDYYWYLNEFIPDKTLVADKELEKIELNISTSREPLSIERILSSLGKDGDSFKNCLISRLHQDERFLLIDKDIWSLKREINKRVFRAPQETVMSEMPPEPVSIVELALAMDSVLKDVEEVSQKREAQDTSSLKLKQAPLRYALTDSDINGGSIKIFSSMKHYFPDHPMIIQIKVCGTLKEYTAYLNNRTGYIRGLENLFKDSGWNRGDVILVIPMDIEKRVYRFLSRNEKNSYPTESWRIKQFKQLKALYDKDPISLTNLVLQCARIFSEVDVHFDSIYEEINAICPVNKELVLIILEKLPFCNRSSRGRDLWSFDDNKFNKFLILALTNLISEFSVDEVRKKSMALSGKDDKEKELKDLVKVRDDRIKELENTIEKNITFLKSSKNEVEEANTKMKTFEKLSEIRLQQIDSLNKNNDVMNKRLQELEKSLEDAKKVSLEQGDIKALKKKMLALQDVLINNKKLFIKVDGEKKELEKAVLAMDKINSTLEKEKAEYLKQIETIKKELNTTRDSSVFEKDRLSSQTSKMEEQDHLLEDLKKKLSEKEIEIERQESEINRQKELLEEKDEEIIKQQEEIEKKNEEIEQALASSLEEPDGPPVPAFDIDISGEYEEKISEKDQAILEKDQKISEIEEKINSLEKLKKELGDTISQQKETIVNFKATIEEKDLVLSEKNLSIERIKKDLEQARNSSSEENEITKELRERIEILESELDNKTNLYNTNLNMQFKLNKDIYKLQKRIDFLRDIVTFLSEELTSLMNKEHLNFDKMNELSALMNGEDLEPDDVVISSFNILESAFEKIYNMVFDIDESYSLLKEEIEILKGFKESFEEEKNVSQSYREVIDKQTEEVEFLKQENQKLKNSTVEIKSELDRLSKIPIFGGMVKKNF